MKLAIVIARSNRNELYQQTVRTLKETLEIPYQVYEKNGMEKGELATVNELVKSIDFDWEYLLRSDDDMFYASYWFDFMHGVLTHNPEIKLINGCRFPTHEVLEEHPMFDITEIAPGNSWLLSRDTWRQFGPIEIGPNGEQEDMWFCHKVRNAGFKVAVLKSPYRVVHCGITNANGRGRGDEVRRYMMDAINHVGALYL